VTDNDDDNNNNNDGNDDNDNDDDNDGDADDDDDDDGDVYLGRIYLQERVKKLSFYLNMSKFTTLMQQIT
jgi:hypothetical protein